MTNRLSPFSKTLFSSFDYYRKNFKVLGSVTLIYLFWLAANQIIDLTVLKGSVGVAFLMSLLGVFLMIWLDTVIIYNFDKPKTSFWEAIKFPREIYFRNLIITLLFGVIQFGGYFLFIVPGIIFLVWFQFVLWESTHHAKSGLRAFSASREKTRGFFWPILGRSLLLAIPAILIVGLQMYINFNYLGSGVGTVFGLIPVLLLAVYYTFSTVFWNYIYKELFEIKRNVVVKESSGRKYLLVGVVGWLIAPLTFVVVSVVLYLIFERTGNLNKLTGKSAFPTNGRRESGVVLNSERFGGERK